MAVHLKMQLKGVLGKVVEGVLRVTWAIVA